MKILFLSSIFPRPHAPLTGIYCYYLCRALSAQSEVTVVSPMTWTEKLRHPAIGSPNGSPFANDLAVHYPCYFYTPKMLRNSYGWFMWHSIKGQLKPIADRFIPDCVVSYWAHPDGEVAVRLARERNIPAVVTVGGSDVLQLTHDTGRRRRIVQVLAAADAVVCTSRDLCNKIAAFGVTAEKRFVVSRGVDQDQFHPGDRRSARVKLRLPESQPMLLWVGRMAPEKGLPTLLQACRGLNREGIDYHLYLIGDGPQKSALQAECVRACLERQVTFVGAVSHDALPDWYRAASWTVLPSLSEGIPNVLRESLACGTPFIASRVGGIPELAEGPVCKLTIPGDVRSLTENLRAALAMNDSEIVVPTVSSTWDESADALLTIIQQAIAARKSVKSLDIHSQRGYEGRLMESVG